MSKRKFVLGALFGAVAGVVAGVLTAPKSGKETRADLKKKANELKKRSWRKSRRGQGSRCDCPRSGNQLRQIPHHD